ncbi:hypothetical protein ACVIQY_002543 [Bradyrhizobium sp. USDA 3051]
MKPFHSRVTIIWWTDGGLTRKMALHVGFGRWASERVRVGVDKSQIVPLLLREVRALWLIAGFGRASDKEAKHECTLSGRIEPNRGTN